MGPPVQLTSPYVMSFEDYIGRAIDITVTFDNTTRVLTGVTVHRDSGCLFTRILIGIGQDGTPDSTTRSVNVPVGTTVLSAGQLNALRNNGMNTIEEFTSYQITAGLPL